MISKTVKSCGVSYNISVPETAEEFDSLAKRPGACVEEAVSNVIYRGTNADFRGAYLDKLVEHTGIQRPTKEHPEGVKDAEGNVKQVFVNSEGKDIDLIVAQAKLSDEQCQSIASTISVTFDPSERERKVKEPNAGKQDLELAAGLLSGDPDKLKKAIKNIKKVGGVDVVLGDDAEANKKAIALGLKAWRANMANVLTA